MRGFETVASRLDSSIAQAGVAEGNAILQAGVALVHFPATEGKSVFFSSRAHVTVDEGDVIANRHGPLRMAFNHRIDNTTSTPHSGVT